MENSETGTSPKTIAIIAYITIIGTLIAIILNKNKDSFVKFHIRQALGIMLLILVVSWVNVIPFLGQIVFALAGIVIFILWIIGLMAAVNEEEKTIPLLGDQFQEWFKSI